MYHFYISQLFGDVWIYALYTGLSTSAGIVKINSLFNHDFLKKKQKQKQKRKQKPKPPSPPTKQNPQKPKLSNPVAPFTKNLVLNTVVSVEESQWMKRALNQALGKVT